MEDDQDFMEVQLFQYLQSPQDHGVIVSHGEVIKIHGVNAMGSPALVTCTACSAIEGEFLRCPIGGDSQCRWERCIQENRHCNST